MSYKNVHTEALVVEEPKADFKLVPIILDGVREGELLVEMQYSGICHTDIVLQQGLLPMVEFPAVFGHEGAGVIREIGPNVKDKSLSVGDSVLLSFHTCGTCKQCVGNHPAYCHSHPQVNHNAVRLTDGSTPGTLQDGRSVRSQYFGHSSFARMSIVPQACVVKCPYPEAMPFYSPLGCGFQTGAGTIMNVLKPAKEQSVVIFGLGSVGLTALMACTHLGLAQVVAVDVVDDKLILAKELGATDMLNSRGLKDVVAEVKRITHGGADFTIDCTGLVPVIETMIDCLAPCGTAVTVGVPPPNVTIRIDPLTFLLENKRYIGVIEGDSVPQKFIPELMELHQKGEFPIEKICKIYSIKDLDKALEDLHGGKVIKPVLKWD